MECAQAIKSHLTEEVQLTDYEVFETGSADNEGEIKITDGSIDQNLISGRQSNILKSKRITEMSNEPE